MKKLKSGEINFDNTFYFTYIKIFQHLISVNYDWDCIYFFLYKVQYVFCPCMLNCFSHVWLFTTLWSIAHQAPLSMGFYRQECLSGLPCRLPGNFPDSGIELASLSCALAGRFFTTSTTWEAHLPLQNILIQLKYLSSGCHIGHHGLNYGKSRVSVIEKGLPRCLSG